MNFSCPKCPKMLSTRQRLDTHLEKTVPCDLQCRDCPFKATTKKQYNSHIRKPHPKIANTKNDSLERFHIHDLANDKNIIPLQDFDKEYMDMLNDYTNNNNAEAKVNKNPFFRENVFFSSWRNNNR